mmetsp:Transcript_22405/g.19323  ORF Transcript_22405/g.19323 Transcript_22405/m.19323 type:complete len:254 (-) Transcript_22405:2155-2916(-)
MLPSEGRMLNHNLNGLIKFIIVRVEENSLWPELVSFANTQKSGDIEILEMNSNVLQKSFRIVFGIQDTQFGINTNMGSIHVHGLFQETDHLIDTFIQFIIEDKLFKMVRMDDNVHTSSISDLVFTILNTSNAKLLPSLGGVGLLGGFEGSIVLLQSDQARGDLSIVLKVDKDDLSSFIQLVSEASVTSSWEISTVGVAEEVLKIDVLSGLGEAVKKFGIDHSILGGLSGHQEILGQEVIFLFSLGAVDDTSIV